MTAAPLAELCCMTTDQDKINQELERRVRELEGHRREAHGRESERWAAQAAHNTIVDSALSTIRDHVDGKFSILFAKITHLEVKVAAFSAAAAAAGAAGAKYLLP